MPRKKQSWVESVSTRYAAYRKRTQRRFRRAFNQPGSALMVVFGAALSVGGVSEALNSVHFAVRKDLDRVQVVRKSELGEKLVADVQESFAANSIFKLSHLLPDRYVTREARLFDAAWFETETRGGSLHQDITLINDEIRRQFFSTEIPFGDLIHEKAQKYDVDPALVAAVIEQESRFRVRALSHRGAQGLMQLMPRTGRWMGAKDLYDPEENVDAGVKYLKYLEKRFDGDLTQIVAAYNAGEGNVMKYGGKVPPFRETRTYVKKVMRNYEKRKSELQEYTDSSTELAQAR